MTTVNPQKISEKQVEISGLKINYKIIGGGKTPIVLLHGWGVSSDKYLELAIRKTPQPPLSGGLTNPPPDKGGLGGVNSQFKIIIPDFPGFGKSDEPGENWKLDDFVEFVDEFIKKTNRKGGFELLKNILKEMQDGSTGLSPLWSQRSAPKIILIGHSFGGRIAIKYAAKYPEKIDKLILTGAAGIKHKLTAKQKMLFVAAKTGKMIFSLPIINKFQKLVYNTFSKMARSRKKDYYQASPRMKEVMKNVLVEDLTDCLNKIKIPTLLVWGRKDKTTPLDDGKIMNEKIKNSKLVIVDGANHSLPYQKAEEFAEIVEGFIKINSTWL